MNVIVHAKSNDDLLFQGATIKTDEDSGKIIIARIMHGGAADRSGLIHVGDEVIEVNGINVEGKTPNDVLAILVCLRLNLVMLLDPLVLVYKLPFVLCVFSKTQREPSTLSFCRQIQRPANERARFECVLILTTSRTQIHIFRARRLDFNSIVEMCFTSYLR